MLSKVMLIGYAGADSEMKFTAAGIPLERLVSLAIAQSQTSGSFAIPGFGKVIKKHREARVGLDQDGQPFQITAKDAKPSIAS